MILQDVTLRVPLHNFEGAGAQTSRQAKAEIDSGDKTALAPKPCYPYRRLGCFLQHLARTGRELALHEAPRMQVGTAVPVFGMVLFPKSIKVSHSD